LNEGGLILNSASHLSIASSFFPPPSPPTDGFAVANFLIFTSDFLGRFLILILSLAGGLFRDDLNVLVPVLSKLVKSAHGRRPVQAV
jgi:hypothetical protein